MSWVKPAESSASQADLRRLGRVAEDSSDALTVQDLDGRILAWNQAAERLYGYSREEALQLNVRALVPEDGRARARAVLEATARGEEVASEAGRLTKDGRTLRVWLTTSKLVDAQGRAVGVVTRERDITDPARVFEVLRETDQAERHSTALLRAITNNIPDPIFVKDDKDRRLFVNAAALAALGKSAEQVVGRTSREVFEDPATADAIAETDRRVMETGEPVRVEERVRTANGYRWYLSTKAPLRDEAGKVIGLVGVARDITAQKQADEALRANEERLRLFVEHAPAPVAMLDRDLRYLVVSRRFVRDYRLPRDVIGRSHYDVFPEIPESWKEVYRRCLGGAVESCEEAPFPRADGTVDWVHWEIRPWRTAAGEIGGIILFSEIITERKRNAEVLRESEERFRLLVQGAKDCAIYMLSPDGTVSSWNAGAEQILGYREEEIVGRDRGCFFTEEDRRAGVPHRSLDQAETKGRYEQDGWLVRKDGSRFWANVLLTSLRDDVGTLRGFANVTRDFTERRQSEIALRESEERLRLAQEVARVGAFEWDLRSGVNTWTPELEALYGLPPGGFPKTEAAWEKLVHPADRAMALRLVQRAFETGAPTDGEWRVTWPDGSIHWIAGRCQVLEDASGTPVRMTGIHIDITDRKRAEEALESKKAELEAILDRTPFMLTRCSRDLRYRYASRAYAEMIGRSPEEIAGRPISEIVGEEGFDTIRPHVEAVLRGELVEYEDDVHLAGVGARLLHAIYVPDRDEQGRVIGWTANIVDVTEQRQAEALRTANAQLLEADRQRTTFLAMLSHELRNPLAPIRNSLYILERAAPGGEQARRAMETLHRQVGHVTRLIDDLLDVTRITHGKVQLQRERVDVNEIVHRTVEDHRTVFVKSGVRLQVLPAPAEVWVIADRVRLAQVVGNVLQNAAKFTPRGGKTTISVQTDTAGGQCILTVQDTGSGISPEMLPRLFHAFTQADTTLDRSKGGLGLGLSLVKGLVEMHGGSVTARSGGLGKGATFTITLPLDATAAVTRPAPRGPSEVAAGRRVLVIEDNEDAADTLREVLQLHEHAVEVAYSGREGIEKARVFRPDVVLCDIGLPEMDGYEVARTMRADPELGRVGLVAVSGYAQPEDVAMAKAAGFDAHLAKPPSLDTLVRALAEVGREEGRIVDSREDARERPA